jgi:RNA polymerase sigma-70 factor (ECF subfamily)
MHGEPFSDFVARIRAGDQEAATDLVRDYEPIIRREVRLRLSDPSVYRVVGDDDVCQSVLRSFFTRAALGQYDLSNPAQLRQLLVAMARNKLAAAARREHADKRGGGRVAPEDVGEAGVAGDGATASRIAAGRELLQRVRSQLNTDERAVADLRGQGHDWAEVARQLGGTADGRRMQLARALDRVSRELGLEDADD